MVINPWSEYHDRVKTAVGVAIATVLLCGGSWWYFPECEIDHCTSEDLTLLYGRNSEVMPVMKQ